MSLDLRESLGVAKARLLKKVHARSRLHRSYVEIFSTDAGKEVLRHLMSVGCVTSATTVKGDPQQTQLNEGKRMLVMSILKFVHKDEERLIAEIERGMQDETQ